MTTSTHLDSSAAAPLRQVLSTASVPEPQQLEYWLETVCSMYCRLECIPPSDERIFGSIEFSSIGALQLTRLQSNGWQVRRTQDRIRAGNDDHHLVLILHKGRAVVQQDGRTAILQPGDFVFHDCTRPYTLLFDPPYHEVQVLRLARSQLESHVSNLSDLTAVTVPGSGMAGRLLLPILDTMQRHIDHLHPVSAHGISEAVINVIGAGLRCLPNADQRRASSLVAYHLARIKAYVQENLRDPTLCVGSIASAMQLSPDRVSKLFSREPLPLSRLIWQMRLDACSRELTDPGHAGRSVSDIAFSWGFNDAAHFSRSFRRQHGVSPREWRLLGR